MDGNGAAIISGNALNQSSKMKNLSFKTKKLVAQMRQELKVMEWRKQYLDVLGKKTTELHLVMQQCSSMLTTSILLIVDGNRLATIEPFRV
jgi:hypothetical protein